MSRGQVVEPALWTLVRRGAEAVDRAVFPEATSPTDQWQRVVMNEAVTDHIASLDPPRCTAAEISGDAQQHHPWKNYRSLDYPQFDLCEPSTEGPFDVVICEQVLEHVVDPWAAARNLRELCAPGGHVIVSTPFLVKIHELPLLGMRDYWRFTPRGLRVLLEGAGLEVRTVGTWGNRVGVIGNLSRWSAHRRWLPLGNRKDLPVVVWAFARRTGS